MLSTAMVRPILETMYDHRSEMVPCFIGAPGIGKTQGLYEFAKDKGVDVVTFILSNTVPSEVSGIRMPDKESKKMEVFDDMRMASLKDGDILFFDEILEAPPMLWSACLTLIQDRIMASGRKLPDVFIVAASNKVASPGIIPASTRDRFQFIELRFDFEHWSKWFEDRYGVEVPMDLCSRIQDDSDQYNILTPRRVTKLYEWLKDPEGIGEKIAIVNDMFDSQVTRLIMKMVNVVKSPKQQVVDALGDLYGSEVESIRGKPVDGMSVKELLETLQSLPDWDEVSKVLAGIELVQEDLDDIEF